MSEDIFTTFKLIAKQKSFLEEIKIDWLMKASSKKLIWEQSRTKIVYYGSLENNNNNFLKYNYCVFLICQKNVWRPVRSFEFEKQLQPESMPHFSKLGEFNWGRANLNEDQI